MENAKHTASPWHISDTCIVGANGDTVVDCRGAMSGLDTEADKQLLTAAPQAPHDCADPACPGAANKRKLEAFADMLAALKSFVGVTQELGGTKVPEIIWRQMLKIGRAHV